MTTYDEAQLNERFLILDERIGLCETAIANAVLDTNKAIGDLATQLADARAVASMADNAIVRNLTDQIKAEHDGAAGHFARLERRMQVISG